MLFRTDATFVDLVRSPYSKMDRPPTTIIIAVVFCVLSQLRRTSRRALDIETVSGLARSQFAPGVAGFNSSLCAARATPRTMATRAVDRRAAMLLSIMDSNQATRLRFAGFGFGSSPAMPERTTGAQSGNSAISERFPPIASTVLRSVDSKRSVRFSRRETLSWVTPSVLAIRSEERRVGK